ncbi:MAG TPA: efflux transporter outer membrane subunit [Bryobacteraceae bacterium]
MKLIAVAAVSLLLASCRVGPDYSRPSAPVAPAFREQPPAGWKEAQPNNEGALKGKWWEIYNDSVLNALEEQVSVSNQNVLQAEATFREAKAAVSVARAALFPTVTTSPAATATGSGKSSTPSARTGFVAGGGTTLTTYTLPFEATWEPDLWGNVRRGVTAAVATAQSQAANLENVKLLYQSELAQDYFGAHGIDAEADLLTRTEAMYKDYLKLTQDRFNGGIASDLDVAQAETQLYSVEQQLIELGVQRTAYEHAIAILIGKPPAEVSIARGELSAPPQTPVGVPSQLLERRPDIAMSERQVAAANEQIGIAISAFYPTLTLAGEPGLASSSLTTLFTWPARFWSVGATLAETLFDAGRRRAVVDEERAAYDATVAAYRQTVLTAFQQVEDNLAALRILQDEAGKARETTQAAQRALDVSTAQYRAGTANYLTVITSQGALLTAQDTEVILLARRATASVMLVQALGGGWNASELPARQDVARR